MRRWPRRREEAEVNTFMGVGPTLGSGDPNPKGRRGGSHEEDPDRNIIVVVTVISLPQIKGSEELAYHCGVAFGHMENDNKVRRIL